MWAVDTLLVSATPAPRYTTLDRIAVGGMGEVFLARQDGLGGFRRTVVLKRLLPDVEGDDDMVRRFLDEARVAAALSHENVVSILEVGDDGSPFIALEYVHGINAGALRTKARRKKIPFPVVAVARIIADAARGLAHAHEAHDVEGRPLHIVHRDVSPKNIFVRADGASKIGDFGIAKSDHRLSRTATGQVPGTLSYMAPEQARGDAVDARCDQFSLGIVLWELLVGQPLFKADSPQETLRKVLTHKVPRPSRARADAATLDRVCLRMLERDPARRFPTLADAAAAIESTVPEARAELGQRAVAAFLDELAGDDLRERQRRIEQGPDDTQVVRERPPPTPSPNASSFPPITPGDASVDTPATGGDATTPVTRNERRSGSGAAVDAAGPARRRTSSWRASRVRAALVRAPVVAASVFTVLTASGVAAAMALRTPTAQERTLAYLEDARATNPMVHRAVFLAMASEAHVDAKKAGPAADKLVALLEKRVDLNLGAARKHGAVDHAQLVAAERAIEGEAKAVLAGLGDADLAADEIDMWDYDAGAPARWMEPDAPLQIQRDLQNGGLEFITSQAAMRAGAVAYLLQWANADAKAAHAVLDPVVAERERLIKESATAPEAELRDLDKKIARLAVDGEQRLGFVVDRFFAHAIANVAFVTVASPDAWQPIHDLPPTARDDKAQGKTAPETH